jgi:hypothetical protein
VDWGETPFYHSNPSFYPTDDRGTIPTSFTRNLPQPLGPPQGGIFHQPHQGGSSNPNPQGGTLIPILLDCILDNPSQGSQIPLGVLKVNHPFLPKGKFLTLLKVNLVTLLREKLVTYLKFKLTILPWVTLVIPPREKWVFLLLL